MKENEEVMFIEDSFNTTYNWNIGKATGRFLRELRDHARIVGSRCPKCHRVMVPPRLVCARCFVKAEEGVEVSDRGEVVAHSVVYQEYPNQPVKPPYIIALIRMEGADTNLVHIIYGENPLPKGTKVKPVWKKEREGDIFDIECFETI